MKHISKGLTVRTASELLAMKFPDDKRVIISADKRTCMLNFAYPYEVDLAKVKTERDLLSWVLHLSEKTWMTADRIHIFITRVAAAKGFQITPL